MQREPLWPKIRGYVLWLISGAIGLMALFAAYETVRVLTPALLPLDPMHTTEYLGQIRVIQNLSLFVLGIIWVAWYIALIERYPRSKSGGELLRRFAITTIIQAAIFALYWAAPTIARLVA